MTPVILPEIVSLRWREAVAAPTIPRWHSLAQMIASLYMTSAVYAPDSPLTDDLRFLSDVAYRHALLMQPEMELAA